MTWTTSLVTDTGASEQVVRRPRRTDAIGATLRRSVVVASALPEDMAALLRRLDRVRRR